MAAKRVFLSLLVVAVACGIGWLVHRATSQRGAAAKALRSSRPLAVEVTRVRQEPIEDRVDLVGSLEAKSDVEVRSRISGYITKLPFDVGDRVAQHDADGNPVVLVKLEDADLREQMKWAQASLRVAQAQLQSSREKQDLAQKNLDRNLKVAQAGATSLQERQTLQAELAIAQAEVQLQLARTEQARSEIQRMQLSLAEAEMVAPLSGFVAERYVDVGHLASPDEPLLRLVDLSTLRTLVHVVEKDYQRVRIGQQARVGVDAFPGEVFFGEVVRVAPVLDPATRTAAVQIEIQNEAAMLKPGMHARVSLVFRRRPDARVVPIASLVEHEGQPSLYLVGGEPPRTRLQLVEVGIQDGYRVEITRGVELGDRVVTLGSRLVEHDQQVTPIEHPYIERPGYPEPALDTEAIHRLEQDTLAADAVLPAP